jgi:N-acetylglucosaminyl-diphospho-decaprenol L-rhamnosyltransferase
MTNIDITVIITTFKSEEKINNCLKSIKNNVRVLVIENSNNQIFKKEIEAQFSNVECILANENLGYGRGNNIGLRKVKTKYALIINPDTILEEDAISNFFERVKNGLNFAIIGPILFQGKNIYKDTELKSPALIKVDNVKGFAMFLNVEKISNVGFFDENFFLYFEEIDLCRRLKKNNENIYLDPKIKIFHEGGKSVNKNFSNQIELNRNWHWMWSSFYYHKKHNSYLFSILIMLPKLISAFIKFIFYSIKRSSNKKLIYKQRIGGLLNSIIGRKSWYRPNLD